MTASALATATLVQLGRVTNRTFVLPLLIFYPTGRCNSRCVSCDWWKQSGADDLTLDQTVALKFLPRTERADGRRRRGSPGAAAQ